MFEDSGGQVAGCIVELAGDIGLSKGVDREEIPASHVDAAAGYGHVAGGRLLSVCVVCAEEGGVKDVVKLDGRCEDELRCAFCFALIDRWRCKVEVSQRHVAE